MAVFSEPPDFANGPAGAITLGPDDAVDGNFGGPADRDVFRIRAEPGFDYVTAVRAPQDGPHFEWEHSARAGDGAGAELSLTSRMGRTDIPVTAADLAPSAPPGTEARDFFVTLDRTDTGLFGVDYRLTVLREEGSTAATRASLAPGERHDGAFEYRGDIDVFALEAQAGSAYAVTFDRRESRAAGEGPSLSSLTFELRGPSDDGSFGAPLEVSRGATFGVTSFRFEAEQTGVHYFVMTNGALEADDSDFGDETGSYTLSMIEDEPQDPTSPLRFEVGTPVLDSVDFVGEQDWYGTTLKAGLTHDVFFGIERGLDGAVTARSLGMFDADGQEVARFDSRRAPDAGGPFPPVSGSFTPDADGLYFFSGADFDALGRSRLEVTIPPQALTGSDDVADELEGGPAGDVIDGRGLDDTLRGLAGNDRLLGGSGDDRLVGGSGDDTLDGGGGADRQVGGRGDDLLLIDSRGDIAIGGEGVDTVRSSVDLAIRDSRVERVEAVGDGDLRLTGTGAAEELVGNDGDNILIGKGGSDTLTGSGGADVFVINGSGRSTPDLRVTDFGEGDRLAVDDRLLGLGGARVDLRDLTPELGRALLRDGIAAYDGRTGELRIDQTGDGRLQTVATLDGAGRIGFDDILLF